MPEPTDQQSRDKATEVVALVKIISPFLAGRGPEVQSAVIADLLAMFLAGHVGPDANLARAAALRGILRLVRQLIPVDEAEIMDSVEPRGSA